MYGHVQQTPEIIKFFIGWQNISLLRCSVCWMLWLLVKSSVSSCFLGFVILSNNYTTRSIKLTQKWINSAHVIFPHANRKLHVLLRVLAAELARCLEKKNSLENVAWGNYVQASAARISGITSVSYDWSMAFKDKPKQSHKG